VGGGQEHPRVKPSAGRHLSAADAAFLYLERKELPLHIAVVLIFDGPIPFEEFVASAESKLPLVPSYKQVVVVPPLNLGSPAWQDDPHFDIRRHIFRVTLDSPGGEAELEDLAGRILSPLLDRNKPLWDIHVVDGLKDGRGAMIWRMHHALADGVSGMRLIELMLDSTPEGSTPISAPRHHAPKRSSSKQPLTDGIDSAVHSALEGLIAVEKGLLGFAQTLLSDRTQDALKGIVGLLPELAASIERLPFNRACSGDRKFCWADFDFADVKAIRHSVGGKVNDIILTVLTRALARYVRLHGQTVANRFVRIVCPVNLRNGDNSESPGNQISFMPVALPMDVRDPVQMLQAVSKRTETMKHAGAAHLIALAGGCIAAAPAPLQALLWSGIPQVILPVPLFNMVCTDVPGPRMPLYAVRRRMIAIYPQVPTGWDLGINCAVQTYDGKLRFGLIADAHVAPDVRRLRDFLYIAFEELCRSAGIKHAGSKKSRDRVAAPRAQRRRVANRAAAVATPAPERARAARPGRAPGPRVIGAEGAA